MYHHTTVRFDADDLRFALSTNLGLTLGDDVLLLSDDAEAWEQLSAYALTIENALRAKTAAGAGEAASAEAPAEDVA